MQPIVIVRVVSMQLIVAAITLIGFVSAPALAAEGLPPIDALGGGRAAFRGSASSNPGAASILSHQPIAFIENQGQWEEKRLFVANRGGIATTLEPDAVVLQFLRDGQLTVVRLAFADASPAAALVGKGRLPGVYNFLIGDDPTRWRTGVPTYSKVVYNGIWEGVDLRIHEKEGRLKYDVVVAPGAQFERVAIRGEGFTGLTIEPDGSLAMQLPGGDVIRQPEPVTWQETGDGERHVVPCDYRLIDETHYTFDVPERDPNLPLVIDPGLEWSTYLGGTGQDFAWSVASANTGEVIIAGEAAAFDFPTTAGVYQPDFQGTNDGFVSCLDPDQVGNAQLVWSTYLGGLLDDRILAVVLASGHRDSVLVCGGTNSTDFPTTPGSYDPTFNGGVDAFVTRLRDQGSALVYSTYLGENGLDVAEALQLDATGALTVGGLTYSALFPTTPGAYDTSFNGVSDAFVTRLDPWGEVLVYSTFLGGSDQEGFYRLSNYDIRFLGLGVTSDLETIVAGRTRSADFPTTPGAYDTSYNGPGADAFVTRLNATGSDLVWSTFLGGSGEDGTLSMTLTASEDAAVGAYTKSNDMPTTPGAFTVTAPGGFSDAHVALLDGATGSHLLYGTYLGGANQDWGPWGIAADPVFNDLILTVYCDDGFPVSQGAYDPTFNGVADAVVVRLSPDGNGANDLIYSTYVGGTGNDGGLGVVLDASIGGGLEARAIVAGWSSSSDFPTTAGAYQTTSSDTDAFACRIGPLWPASTTGVPGAHANASPAAVRLVGLQPNPTPGSVAYRVELPEAARVGLRVYDLHGRLVAKLIDRRLGPGAHDFSWEPAEALPPGTYVLRLDSDGKQEAQKIVLIP